MRSLEWFFFLVKSVKRAAAVELVKQALEAPSTYVFGESLDMAHIYRGKRVIDVCALLLTGVFVFFALTRNSCEWTDTCLTIIC